MSRPAARAGKLLLAVDVETSWRGVHVVPSVEVRT